MDVSNQVPEADNYEGQLHGPESRCFEFGRGWTRTDVVSNIASTTVQGAGCYQVRVSSSWKNKTNAISLFQFNCSSDGVQVQFMGIWLQCQCEGEEVRELS